MTLRAAVLTLLLATPVAVEVTITPQGDRVSVHAVAAPLSDVLEQLSRTTGMKVIYEGAAPRLPVTVTVEGRTPVQAVLAVMEGQGLNFALRSDDAGQRVDRLLIAGQAHASGVTTPSTPVPAPGAGDTNLTFDQDESVDEKGEENPEPAIKLPAPATRAPGPPTGPAFQAPQPQVYPNSPFAPQPQAQAPPPPPLPQPEPEEETELD